MENKIVGRFVEMERHLCPVCGLILFWWNSIRRGQCWSCNVEWTLDNLVTYERIVAGAVEIEEILWQEVLLGKD